MAELESGQGARQHLYTLRNHVLGPLSAAERLAERERSEVASEREAFQELRGRLESIDPVRAERQQVPLASASDEPATQRTTELRDAYSDTVMDVSHYEAEYDEPLEANVTVELGAELAEVFRPGSAVAFSPQHKALLIRAVEQTVQDRDSFCDALDSEVESIQSMHRDLSGLLDTLDNSIVPAWHSQTFLEEVDAVQASRQSTLFSRSLPAGYDGHTLCGYLYDDELWTYPGLTAVARLLDSVVLQEE